MTEQERKKGGGSKLSRSETVTVRLDPKLRYLAELASRKQRRTVSSFIEWAIEDSLSRVIIYENSNCSKSIADEASDLWDVDEADRFVNLAFSHSDLMTHDEQVQWKLIREYGHLWRGKYNSDNEWSWGTQRGSLIIERLREKWELLKEVVAGDVSKDALPNWSNKRNNSEDSYEEPPFSDDDIPF